MSFSHSGGDASDFERGTLCVAETCYKGHFGTPKTQASRREIPVPNTILRELLAHKLRCLDDSSTSLVFSTKKGTPLAADNLRNRELIPACERVKIQRIDWHALFAAHTGLSSRPKELPSNMPKHSSDMRACPLPLRYTHSGCQ